MKIFAIYSILIIMAMTNTASAHNDNSAFITPEPEIVIEGWMFEELNPLQESKLKIETWMFEQLAPETEAKPQLEAWMFNSPFSVQEEKPELEAWMFVTENEEENIPIEQWMF